jgi:hypothetical protein
MVLRVGIGIVYSGTADSNGATQGGLTALAAVESPGFGEPVMRLKDGIPFTPPPFPNYDAGQYPQAGYAGRQAPAVWYDRNAGRPARQWQWSIGVQREIFPNLVVEAAYVGNRGAWWNSPGLVDVNANTPERLAAAGFDITKQADRQVLVSSLTTAAADPRVKVPYTGYPLTNTVAQSLRPFPQFTSITCLWCPLGDTWYDSLQLKATKRLSNGLSFSSNFTWSKNMATGSPSNVVVPGTGGGATNDIFNRASNKYLSNLDQPFIYNIALNYTVPNVFKGTPIVSYALRDWTIGAFGTWASGLLIQAPFAQNQTNLNSLLLRQTGANLTYANRVAGEPLFLQDVNCHCFDPNKEFVLNPKAWTNPAEGTFGTGAAYYSDYRWQRQPQENFAFGRTFRIGEKGRSLNIRAEFSNIFNRSRLPTPTSTSATASRTYVDSTGKTQTLAVDASGSIQGKVASGFGFINTGSAPSTPASRQGTIVARFSF